MVNTANGKPTPDRPPRRWSRFSLKTLLLVMVLVSVSGGLWRRAQKLHELADRQERELAEFEATRTSRWHELDKHRSRGWRYGYIPEQVRWRINDQRKQVFRQYNEDVAAYKHAMSAKLRASIWKPWLAFEADPEAPEPVCLLALEYQ